MKIRILLAFFFIKYKKDEKDEYNEYNEILYILQEKKYEENKKDNTKVRDVIGNKYKILNDVFKYLCKSNLKDIKMKCAGQIFKFYKLDYDEYHVKCILLTVKYIFSENNNIDNYNIQKYDNENYVNLQMDDEFQKNVVHYEILNITTHDYMINIDNNKCF